MPKLKFHSGVLKLFVKSFSRTLLMNLSPVIEFWFLYSVKKLVYSMVSVSDKMVTGVKVAF